MTNRPEDDDHGVEPSAARAIIRLLEAGLRQDPGEREEDRRADRKKAGREQLTIGLLMAYTAITALILLAQLYANHIATRDFTAQNRAWVHLKAVAIELDPTGTRDSPVFDVEPTVENVGAAPAFGVGILFAVVAGNGPIPEQADLCRPFRTANNSRSVLFPHSPFVGQTRRLSLRLRGSGAVGPGVAYLVGCIDYSTELGGPHRQTQVVRTISAGGDPKSGTVPNFSGPGSGFVAVNDFPEDAD